MREKYLIQQRCEDIQHADVQTVGIAENDKVFVFAELFNWPDKFLTFLSLI